MQAVTGITSHNARLAHIRKFVMVPPARGAVLRLVTCEEPPCVIGEWTREECVDNSATAVAVDEALREHTQTVQEHTTANLAWSSGEGHVVAGKRLKCGYEPEGMDPALAAQAEALGINGTQQGVMMHQQTVLERQLRLYMAGHQSNQQVALGLVNTLGSMLQQSYAAQHKLHVELDAARAKQRTELDEMIEQLRDAEGGPTSPEAEAKAELVVQAGEALKQVLPLVLNGVMMKLLGIPPGALGNAPPEGSEPH